jgi:hypothetical protein
MANPYYKQHWIEIEAERQQAYDQIPAYRPALEPLIRPLNLRPGLKVLDVGSGPVTRRWSSRDAWAHPAQLWVWTSMPISLPPHHIAPRQTSFVFASCKASFHHCLSTPARLTESFAKTYSSTLTQPRTRSTRSPVLPRRWNRGCNR